jgi:hypothetical protein
MHSMQRRKLFTISYNIKARNSSYFFGEIGMARERRENEKKVFN